VIAANGAHGFAEEVIALDRDGQPESVRRRAIDTLRWLGDEASVAYLLRKAAEPGAYGEVALDALEHLRRADEGAGRRLAEALEGAGSLARAEQAKESLLLALGEVAHTPSLPLVARHLQDRSATVRTAAVRSLGRMEAKAASQVPALEALWPDADATLRLHLAIALGSIRGPEATRALTRMVAEEGLDPNVKRTVEVALRNAQAPGTPTPR
jgi:HEAT repeat protein